MSPEIRELIATMASENPIPEKGPRLKQVLDHKVVPSAKEPGQCGEEKAD